MRRSPLLIICFCLVLSLSLGSCKKSPSPSEEAPPSREGTGTSGEQAQAVGTADTAKTETQASESACTFSTDPKGIKLEWTAYKFTEKTPVKGTFTTANVKGPTSAGNLAALAKGLSMEIDGATIESGDPGRNITVKDFFFSKMNPPFKMQAIVKSLEESGDTGNLTIELNMNGVTKEVPFRYVMTSEGDIIAKGGIDLMNFKLEKAFDSIHQACETLHTGKDGVSKTWELVDLTITGNVQKQCP